LFSPFATISAAAIIKEIFFLQMWSSGFEQTQKRQPRFLITLAIQAFPFSMRRAHCLIVMDSFYGAKLFYGLKNISYGKHYATLKSASAFEPDGAFYLPSLYLMHKHLKTFKEPTLKLFLTNNGQTVMLLKCIYGF
jgi:hypothetical protein